MKKLILMLIVLFPSVAWTAPQWCSGTITGTYIWKDGSLYINGSWRGTWTRICNLQTTLDGVTPEVCKAWMSYVVTGKTTNTPMTVYYSELESCSSIPHYNSAPIPGYVMLRQ